MNSLEWRIAMDRTHHLLPAGQAAYAVRFEEVLRFHPPGLAAVRCAREAWHIRPDGTEGYIRRFLRTFGFYEELAAVESASGWHHIRPDGEDAYTQRYQWCGNFQEGLCPVRDDTGRYFHLKLDGQSAYQERWRYAGDFRDGVAVVQAGDGRSTHIGTDGSLLHARWFLDLDVFHKGFARARDHQGWTHVTVTGVPLYPHRYAAVEPFYNGQSRVERFDGAFEVINEAGEPIIELRSPLRSEFAALSGDLVGFWRTRTIATAVRCGLFEALPGSTDQLAKQSALTLEGANRLLRALGELHLVCEQDEGWRATARGSLLRQDHPLTLADAALEYAGPMSEVWMHLQEALQTGSSWTAPEIFQEVATDPVRCFTHHRMLRSYALHDYRDIPEALWLKGDEHVLDAGGGLGSLALNLLETYPELKVTVLELPGVVERACQEHPKVKGLAWHSGDLLQAWGIQAEVVILARVLHDWDDEKALRILTQARASLKKGDRVFILEMLLEVDGYSGSLCDLHLLMATGGRERTLEEFVRLLQDTGFSYDGVRTVGALPSIIMGVAS